MRHTTLFIAQWHALTGHWFAALVGHYASPHIIISYLLTAIAGVATGVVLRTVDLTPLMPSAIVVGTVMALPRLCERSLDLGDLHTPCRAPSRDRSRMLSIH